MPAEVAILIPVLGRGHLIPDLLESLEGTTNDYRVVFICSPDDEATDVCLASDADTIVVPWQPERADFAKKINLAFRDTEEPWLFQGATDILFSPGWDAAAFANGREKFGVIGTNDLGNPLVKRGKHSTHTLFSRAYIDAGGGPLDAPGDVFSEAYAHEYVDHEFVESAKLRGQWTFAADCVIEHHHPAWGKAETDATYKKATSRSREDRRLYVLRMRTVHRQLGRAAAREARRVALEERRAALRKRGA